MISEHIVLLLDIILSNTNLFIPEKHISWIAVSDIFQYNLHQALLLFGILALKHYSVFVFPL